MVAAEGFRRNPVGRPRDERSSSIRIRGATEPDGVVVGSAGERVPQSGVAADGRQVALRAQGEALGYRNTYGSPIPGKILCDRVVLLLVVAGEGQPLRSDPKKTYANMTEVKAANTGAIWSKAPRIVMAVDAASGKTLWRHESDVISMSLAADAKRVLFHDGQKLQCLDRGNGRVLWSSEPLPVRENMRSSSGATVVIYDDVILYSGMVAAERYTAGSTTMFALSADSGKTLWKGELQPAGHQGTPDDILVAGGLVWHGAVAQGRQSGVMIGRDLHSGEIKSQFLPDVETHWFHHRCYRAKATDKYLLFSRTGIEFIDHAAEHWTCHHWVRGACHYGVMPGNGLIYAPQHPCACYTEAKLSGFNALAPARKVESGKRKAETPRLQRGPAYAQILNPKSQIPNPSSWPTFRHDAARSGATKTAVRPTGLKRSWQTKLGGRLSSPVVAEGKLLVASIDSHAVHALDAASGEPAWKFTAGARVDSPPTIWRGRVLFGSADGYVYCLRTSDGQLIWRYRAAPEDRRMGAFEQIESVWPVHGSVLVINDTVYCIAGRSMFLDGGLRLLRLDPITGRKISETIFDDRDPATGENMQIHVSGLNMPVTLPDILSSDGKYVYMRSLPLNLDGSRKFVTYVPVKEQRGDDVHLFSPTGFLDDTLWHRTYWVYGRAFASGAGGYHQAGRVAPAGRLMVFDDETVYGYGRLWKYYRWTTPLEYHLFAVDKQPEIVAAGSERKPIKKDGKRTGKSRTLAVTRFVPAWSDNASVQTTAMVLADGVLFVAGPPDVHDEEAAVKALDDPAMQKQAIEQAAAFSGRRGGLLAAVSATDGRQLAAYQLDSMPRFDGMIAAAGRLYLCTADGKVLCLGSAEGEPLAEAADVIAARPTEGPPQ